MVSPSRRTMTRGGREIPLIPRYFDLLVLLLERRGQAVHRADILEAVWSDVVVSDGALSQAVRTLRRALGDIAREPRFIRTVSRHGYRFVHPGVVEEPDEAPHDPPTANAAASGATSDPIAPAPTPDARDDPFESALSRLLGEGLAAVDDPEETRREAAESLHALGTGEALRRLDRRPGHERARALLRDARWDVPRAGPVPLLGQPGAAKAITALVWLRLRRAARLAGARWGSASVGGAVSGACAGILGGLLLRLGSGAGSPRSLPAALALIGVVAGGAGAAGVGAGLAFAEAIARSFRGLALVICGAIAGGATGVAAQMVVRWTLEGVFGQDLPSLGGGFEGLAIGGAAGLGYALSTPRARGGGMASPRGLSRLGAALVSGACCALAGLLVCRLGGNLAGTSLNLLSRAYRTSHVGLAPLAHLLGEADPGPLTRALSGGIEGLLFGTGLVAGLTRRPR
jgi:DNA-binding winged helix-turn-helix (wHTH) protein